MLSCGKTGINLLWSRHQLICSSTTHAANDNNDCQGWIVLAAKGLIKVGGVWHRGDLKYSLLTCYEMPLSANYGLFQLQKE
jgi:hypothetical protein